jgi:hypothetical protein
MSLLLRSARGLWQSACRPTVQLVGGLKQHRGEEELAEAAGLSAPQVYQIRDGRR